MLIIGQTKRLGRVLPAVAIALAAWHASAAGWAESPTTTRPATVVDVRPSAIVLNAPPASQVRRSCVLWRRGGGPVNVLGAESSDPEIVVTVAEDRSAGTYIVTAHLPAGYQHQGRDEAEILVTTDLEADARVRIPIRVFSPGAGTAPPPLWLLRAKTWIGRPCPLIKVKRADGREIEFAASHDKVSVLIFSAHYCGHCDTHMPLIQRLHDEYAVNGVEFFGVNSGSGSGRGMVEAVERWGVRWPVGADSDFHLARDFGIKAYPVVFLIGKDGNIESVHGRHNNNERGNGLDNLADDLRRELDILLAGGTRADFPVVKPASATRPASDSAMSRPTMEAATTRPAGVAAAESR